MAYRPLGLLIIAAALALPLVWFIGLAVQRDPAAVFSQYLGSAALIAMSLSQLMATRMPGLESVFGGMDRIYVLHKWLGVGALVLVLLHDTIDADVRGTRGGGVLGEVAETFGEISLYGLLILAVISIALFVPYHLWRWTHRLMGAFFALAAFHFVFIEKPFSVGDPLGLYIGAFCVIGIGAYLFTLLPFHPAKGRHEYIVESIEGTGDALCLGLKPTGRGLTHRPGQFAFVRFDHPGLGEVHPFTISSAPSDGALRFTVKELGDYTDRLARLVKVGMAAHVDGPYGHFSRAVGQRPQVWIAAGIGITPFLAWAQSLDGDAGPIDLFYCVTRAEEAAHLDEVRAAADRSPVLTVHLVESETSGRLTMDRLKQTLGREVAGSEVFFCGPSRMREGLKKGFAAEGLPASRFHFEEFEIRTGIGLRRLADWLLRRAVTAAQAKGAH